MKRPGFFEGVGLALLLSLAGAGLYILFRTVIPVGWLLHGLVAGMALAYVLYLLLRSPERLGRVTTVFVWTVITVLTWMLQPPFVVTVLVHVGMIWLVRALYFHASVLTVLADLGLNILALAAAVWATLQSGSLFLAIWCFFLVQALFVLMPKSLRPAAAKAQTDSDLNENRFRDAQRAAQAALRQLSTVN